MKISAIILAGGIGTRMGRKNKGLLIFNGKPLIEHVLEKLHDQVSNIVINKRLINEFLHLGYNNLSIQNPINGTGGAIKQFISNNKLNADYYLICLGDTYL